MDMQKLVKPFRIDDGKKFRLKDISPKDTRGIKSKERALELLQQGVDRLRELQDRLYAQDCWAVLLIFQAMDAAGKDGTIKHVMSGINPQGCQVFSFKAPSNEELDHDLPVARRTGAARTRPHRHLQPVLLRGSARRPRARGDPEVAEAARVAHHQGHLARAVRGHLQLRALPLAQRRHHPKVLPPRLERGAAAALPEPSARAGQELEVLDGRRQGAELLGRVSGGLRRRDPADRVGRQAPWYVVPADHKWFTRMVVAAAVVDALEELDLDVSRSSTRTSGKS